MSAFSSKPVVSTSHRALNLAEKNLVRLTKRSQLKLHLLAFNHITRFSSVARVWSVVTVAEFSSCFRFNVFNILLFYFILRLYFITCDSVESSGTSWFCQTTFSKVRSELWCWTLFFTVLEQKWVSKTLLSNELIIIIMKIIISCSRASIDLWVSKHQNNKT